MSTDHCVRELRTLQSAVLHLSVTAGAELDAKKLRDLGLTSYAWLTLPGEEAAAIERACSDTRQRCEHGWLSICTRAACVAKRNQIHAEWNAEAQADRAEDAELAREPEEAR